MKRTVTAWGFEGDTVDLYATELMETLDNHNWLMKTKKDCIATMKDRRYRQSDKKPIRVKVTFEIVEEGK